MNSVLLRRITGVACGSALFAALFAASPAQATPHPGWCTGSTVHAYTTLTYATAGGCQGVQARIDRESNGRVYSYYGPMMVSSSTTSTITSGPYAGNGARWNNSGTYTQWYSYFA